MNGKDGPRQVLLSWLNFHPDQSPEGIAWVLATDVDEIAKLCADLAAAGFIEPPTPAPGCRAGHGPVLRSPAKGWKSPVRGFWYGDEGDGSGGRDGRLSVSFRATRQ